MKTRQNLDNIAVEIDEGVQASHRTAHHSSNSRTSSFAKGEDGLATAEINKHDTSFSSNDSDTEHKDPKRSRKQQRLRVLFISLLVLAAVAYSITAFAKDFNRAKPLLYMEIAVVLLITFMYLSKTTILMEITARLQAIVSAVVDKVSNDRRLKGLTALLTIGAVALIIGLSIDDARRLVSLAGLGVFVLGCWLCSWKRRDVKWRPVIGGLLFQFLFGLLILRWKAGEAAFQFLGNQISNLIKYTDNGSRFVFGWLVDGISAYAAGAKSGNMDLVPYPGIFAFSVLPSIIFFSSIVSMLYYLGVLQGFIRIIGAVLAYLLGTSASESLNAAGNIFVGQTEAPLLIRPFLRDMTESELHAVMTGGFATIAGGVMAIYISFNISASHLLAASVMSAPAALAISKLLYPETETSRTAAGSSYKIDSGTDGNLIEAASNGASIAVKLAINIAGQLITFIAIVSMLNGFLGFFGKLVDVPQLSFEMICGYVLYPVAFLMGVDAKDCLTVGTLLGKKIFINEFVAYLDLKEATNLSERSRAIAVFALCGFSNFSSIGVQLGGLTPIAPNQSSKLAKLVLSSMLAGNIACFMTACIAGLLMK